jgi:predicted ABC-type ATPase
MTTVPTIHILAGPNGAGKTTFAREFLPGEADCPVFINADLIADGLSPFSPASVSVRAGRIMLELIADCVRRRVGFAFETTLAAANYVPMIQRWRASGYLVHLHFLSLPSPEVALERVAERVRQGGHDVPADVVVRRFHRGRDNFERLYKFVVDQWTLYDCADRTPVITLEGANP